MIDVLIFAQIVFYFSASIAIIVIGVLLVFAIYHLVRVSRHLHSIAESFDQTSHEVKDRLAMALENLERLPVFSFLFKSRDRGHKSGRSKK
ncbi:MAG: hypothetical protein G01um101420_764 [Parcubacteria group bacterium Gr01-1014_20]|nr:MAG: hypothetical protein G01um101420_764 [Parcubacteria group bacterium Gr01-1014_20]